MPYTPPVTLNNDPATPVSAEYFTAALQTVGDYADSLVGVTSEERVVRPEDFFSGTPNYGVDDMTECIQDAIDSLADGGGKVKFGPHTYLVTSAPRTDRRGNAIIAFPLDMVKAAGAIDLEPRVVLEGAGSYLTRIKCTRTTDTYSAAYGPPSVIGGPTWEQTRDSEGNPIIISGITNDHLDIGVVLRGIDFLIQTTGTTGINPGTLDSGPHIGCVDFGGLSHATIEDCEFWSTNRNIEPKNKWTFGVRMPGTLNNGRIRVTDLRIFGFYCGLVLGSAHTNLDQITCSFSHVAYGFDSQRTQTDSHVTVGKYVSGGSNHTHIGGWGPVSGLTGLDDPRHRVWLSIMCWDMEDDNPDTPGWSETVNHFYDPNNRIAGVIYYNRTLQGVGPQQGLITKRIGGTEIVGYGWRVTGGVNVTFCELVSGGAVTRATNYALNLSTDDLTAGVLEELPPAVEFVELNGTGTITKITDGIVRGELHTLKANSNNINITNASAGTALTNNLRLSGNWGSSTSAQNDTLTIRWSGQYWVEVSRSANAAF